MGMQNIMGENEIGVSHGHSTSIRHPSAGECNIGLARVGGPLPFIASIRRASKHNTASTNMESVNVSVTN